MRIIPVMDVRDGNVVHAVGGNRADYEPLISDLCATGEPLPLAFSLRERFGFEECYVADLNAIADGDPDLELFAGLVELGLFPWVDAGVRSAAGATRLRATGAAVVVGTETLESVEMWESIIRAADPRRIALSLDLNSGRLVNEPLCETDPLRLVERLFTAADEIRAPGPARLFVLDLARVGQGKGPGTERLVCELSKRYLDCEVIAGGGIRNDIDIERLEREGAAGVLIASALHDGSIQPQSRLAGPSTGR
jgi:phosphoribosylformimino-5-aminoimidazole carboxamide ribotide isomerase